MENKDLLDDDLDWDAELENWTEEDVKRSRFASEAKTLLSPCEFCFKHEKLFQTATSNKLTLKGKPVPSANF